MLNYLLKDYAKALKINYKNNTFEEIKVNPEDKVKYKGLDKWFITFANTHVSEHDRYRFLTFVNTHAIAKHFENGENSFTLAYRRKNTTSEIWRILKIYKIDNETAYLFIQDAEAVIKNVLEAEAQSWSIYPLEEYYNHYSNSSFSTIGVLVVEGNKEAVEEALPYYLFNRTVYSQDNLYFIFVHDITYEKFYCEITKYYRIMDGIEGAYLGLFWTDDEHITAMEAANEAIKNLKLNKEI